MVKKYVWIITCNDKKNIIHLNSDSMVKDLTLNMKMKGGERFKPPHLHPKLVG
jgi:hypothetical protein